ncbi:glutathione S-transferase family protein [soil metagenome]
MELVIGDKAVSSWSLRPWLALKRTGAAFTETLVSLRRPDTPARIAEAGAPAGKLPILKDGDLVVWDSLAICEHLADRFPDARLWPVDPDCRTLARCASAEMHAGFASLRAELPMDLHLEAVLAPSPPVATDIRRIVALWRSLRAAAGDGPWLLGPWSIADAMYAPVCTRFRTYGVDLAAFGDDGTAATYVATALADPHFREWEAAA